VIAQGEVWWADLGDPAGSEPGFRRPVVVVQGEAFNASGLRTVVCVALTSNTRWADAPGYVLLSARQTGPAKASVANVSQIVTIDRASLTSVPAASPRRASSSFWLGSTRCSAASRPAPGTRAVGRATPLNPTISNRCREACRHDR
jgi:mRNA interferase MazF